MQRISRGVELARKEESMRDIIAACSGQLCVAPGTPCGMCCAPGPCDACEATAELHCFSCTAAFCNSCWTRIHALPKYASHRRGVIGSVASLASVMCVECAMHGGSSALCVQCDLMVHQFTGAAGRELITVPHMRRTWRTPAGVRPLGPGVFPMPGSDSKVNYGTCGECAAAHRTPNECVLAAVQWSVPSAPVMGCICCTYRGPLRATRRWFNRRFTVVLNYTVGAVENGVFFNQQCPKCERCILDPELCEGPGPALAGMGVPPGEAILILLVSAGYLPSYVDLPGTRNILFSIDLLRERANEELVVKRSTEYGRIQLINQATSGMGGRVMVTKTDLAKAERNLLAADFALKCASLELFPDELGARPCLVCLRVRERRTHNDISFNYS
jgi:hypothetical protein